MYCNVTQRIIMYDNVLYVSFMYGYVSLCTISYRNTTLCNGINGKLKSQNLLYLNKIMLHFQILVIRIYVSVLIL